MRRSEIFCRYCSRIASALMPAAAARVGDHAVHALALHRAGQDGVDAHAVRAELDGQRLRPGRRWPTCWRVRRAQRIAQAAGDRTHRDDAGAGRRLLQQRHRAPREVVLAVEVDRDRALPAGRRRWSRSVPVGPAMPALLTSTSRPPSAACDVVEHAGRRRRRTTASAMLVVMPGVSAPRRSSAARSMSQTCTRAPALVEGARDRRADAARRRR